LENIAQIAAARAAAKQAVKTMEDALESLELDAQTLSRQIQSLSAKIRDYEKYTTNYQNILLKPGATEVEKNGALRDLKLAKAALAEAAAAAVQISVNANTLYEDVASLLTTAQLAVTLLLDAGHSEEDAIVIDARECAEEAETKLAEIKNHVDSFGVKVERNVYSAIKSYVTREEVEDYLVLPEEEEDDVVVEEKVDSTYLSDNGNIVSVTYGGKDGDDYAAYKTFILNYNNYAVTVKYEVNGVVHIYTIPANDYAVVLH
jgi:hypothetical protein